MHLKNKMNQTVGSPATLRTRKSLRRHELGGLGGTNLAKIEQEKQGFIKTLAAKYGTLTKAWRIGMDADSSGALDFGEFVAALKFLGFTGNIRTLFFNLDADDSGSLTLKELDPRAAEALEKFRVKSTRGYRTMQGMWDELLDMDRSGTVGLLEFQTNIGPLGYNDPDEIKELFEFLKLRPGCRFIMYEDIHFLQCWEDSKQAQANRKRFMTSWVNKNPYLRAEPTFPGMDDPPNEYASMTALDDDHEKHVFKEFLINKFGSLPKAFDAMDNNLSGSLSCVEFQSTVATVLNYCRPAQARRLFLSFNEDPGAMLTWDELGISSPEWQAHVIERKRQRRIRDAGRSGATRLVPIHESPRPKDATARHHWRLNDAVKSMDPKGDVAFWGPLPNGWGFPSAAFDPKPPPSKPWSLAGSIASTPFMTPSASRSTLQSQKR